MPTPSSTLTTLRPDLGGSMQEFDLAMDARGFIGTRIYPVIEAGKPSGTFGKISIEALLQSPEISRTSQGAYHRMDWQFTEDSYATKEYGVEEPVDDRDARIYANYFQAEVFAALRARDVVLRAQEKRVADIVQSTSVFTNTSAVTKRWDDYTNATPINDVETARRAVWAATGLWPNALVIGNTVFLNLCMCDQIKDAIRSSGAGDPTKATDVTVNMLQQVFRIPNVLVGGSAKNTADEGLSPAVAEIWDDEYAFVGRIAQTGDIREPCVGRTIHWGADGSQIGGVIESYYEDKIRANVIRVRHEVQEKTLYAGCGYILSNITA